MTEADISSVRNIDQMCSLGEWSEETYRRELQSGASYAVTRLVFPSSPESRHLAGYGGINLILDEGHLIILAVHPVYRRQGIGKSLLNHLIGVARAKGATSLTLEVRESNTAAQQCYQQSGFLPVGRRPHYYNNNEDAILMTIAFTVSEHNHS